MKLYLILIKSNIFYQALLLFSCTSPFQTVFIFMNPYMVLLLLKPPRLCLDFRGTCFWPSHLKCPQISLSTQKLHIYPKVVQFVGMLCNILLIVVPIYNFSKQHVVIIWLHGRFLWSITVFHISRVLLNITNSLRP